MKLWLGLKAGLRHLELEAPVPIEVLCCGTVLPLTPMRFCSLLSCGIRVQVTPLSDLSFLLHELCRGPGLTVR